MRPARLRPAEGGFTLVESMVAITLLGIGSLALGVLLVRSSRAAAAAAATVQATASLSTEVARLNALPFNLLTADTTCLSLGTPAYPHSRCTTVTSVSSSVRRVTIVVTPTGSPTLRPDTVTFDRTESGGGSPLNTP